MNANELFNKIRVKQVIGTLDIDITDITTDSRTASGESIFVASKGYTVDSHRFCQNVIDQGTKIIVVNRKQEVKGEVTQVIVPDTLRVASILAHTLFDYPSQQLTTFGVTGTNGKTSIATMIHLIYRGLDKNSAYLGTNGFQINEEKQKGQILLLKLYCLLRKLNKL